MDKKTKYLQHVLYWAKTVCENTRAEIGYNDEELQADENFTFPSWLPELEHAIKQAEKHGAKSVEPSTGVEKDELKVLDTVEVVADHGADVSAGMRGTIVSRVETGLDSDIFEVMDPETSKTIFFYPEDLKLWKP